MIVRPATAADAAAIAEIWNRQIRDGVSTFNSVEKEAGEIAAMIAARAAAGHATLIAQAPDGAVLGFASYGQFRPGIGYRHTMEHTVHLAAGAAGQGIGRALMAALERHARAAGVHAMIAGIAGENAGAVAFHARLGYREVARVPEVGRKFGRWMDLIVMQKILDGRTRTRPDKPARAR